MKDWLLHFHTKNADKAFASNIFADFTCEILGTCFGHSKKTGSHLSGRKGWFATFFWCTVYLLLHGTFAFTTKRYEAICDTADCDTFFICLQARKVIRLPGGFPRISEKNGADAPLGLSAWESQHVVLHLFADSSKPHSQAIFVDIWIIVFRDGKVHFISMEWRWLSHNCLQQVKPSRSSHGMSLTCRFLPAWPGPTFAIAYHAWCG